MQRSAYLAQDERAVLFMARIWVPVEQIEPDALRYARLPRPPPPLKRPHTPPSQSRKTKGVLAVVVVVATRARSENPSLFVETRDLCGLRAAAPGARWGARRGWAGFFADSGYMANLLVFAWVTVIGLRPRLRGEREGIS